MTTRKLSFTQFFPTMKFATLISVTLLLCLAGCNNNDDEDITPVIPATAFTNCASDSTPETGIIDNGEPDVSVNGAYLCEEQIKELTLTAETIFDDLFQSPSAAIGLFYNQDNLNNPISSSDYNIELTATFDGAQSIEISNPNPVSVSDAKAELIGQMGEQQYQPAIEIREGFFASTSVEAKAQLEFGLKTLFGGSNFDAFLEAQYSGLTYYYVRGVRTFSIFTHIDSELAQIALQDYEGNCPVYLQEEMRGKLHIMKFESTSLDISAKVDYEAAVNALITSGETSLSVEQKTMLENASLKTLTIGGTDSYSISDILPALGSEEETLPDFVIEGSTYGRLDAGVPIGYRYVYADGTPFKRTNILEYTEATCVDGNPLFVDIRTPHCGTNEGAEAEAECPYNGGNKVVTGIKIVSSDSDIDLLHLQKRSLYTNGNLSSSRTWVECENDDDDYELFYECPDGYVIVNIGFGIQDSDVDVARIYIAEPYLDDNNRVRLRNHETVEPYPGDDPDYPVESYCPVQSQQQIVLGLELRAANSDLTTQRTTVGILTD